MHRSVLTCSLCHQQFFPASLKFHVKVCAKRQENVELPCDHCDKRFPCKLLKAHMKFCKQHKRRAKDNGNMGVQSVDCTKTRRQGGLGGADGEAPSSTANTRADEQQQPSTTPKTANEHAQEPPLRTRSHDVASSVPQQGFDVHRDSISCSERPGDGHAHKKNEDGNLVVTASDGRIACTNCQRWFSSDRVGVHQNICNRVNSPSTRDIRARGKDKTSRSKKASFASSRVECRRRQSSRPVVGVHHAVTRTHGARGRSVGGERRSSKGWHAIDSAGDRMCFGSANRDWMESVPTQAQANTAWTAMASPPGIPLSARAEYRGNRFSSSLGLEGSCAPENEKQHLKRELQRHRRKESSDNRRRARRPSSATDLVSCSEDTAPLAHVSRFSIGRAVSTSCSPIRLRRGSVSTTTTTELWPARNEGYSRRRSSVSVRVGKFGSGGRSEVEFARSWNTSRRGAAGREVGIERLSGGLGFFSPSRDGGRIRFLK